MFKNDCFDEKKKLLSFFSFFICSLDVQWVCCLVTFYFHRYIIKMFAITEVCSYHVFCLSSLQMQAFDWISGFKREYCTFLTPILPHFVLTELWPLLTSHSHARSWLELKLPVSYLQDQNYFSSFGLIVT